MDKITFTDKNGLCFLLDETNYKASITYSENVIQDVFIPYSINYNEHEYLITSIGKKSFIRNKKIKSVSFPDNSKVQSIQSWAFASSSLVNIKIPTSLTIIDEYAFDNSDLNSIEIPQNSNLQIINSFAFSGTKITKFTIPPKLKEIKVKTFSSCELLQIIDYYPKCELKSINSSAFAFSGLKILKIPPLLEKLNSGWCLYARKLKQIIVSPQNNNFCFLDNNYLIGKSNKDIQIYDYLYFVSQEINDLVIPSFIKIIGEYAFSNCKQIKTIKFNENSECCCFDDFSFFYSSIESISIPPKVTVIKKGAFYQCKNLKTIDIPLNSELKKIGKKAFASTNISSLYFPSKLTELENSWCSKTKNLNTIIISPENRNFTIVQNQYLYGKTNKNSEIFDILYFARRDIEYENLFIPLSTKIIGSCAFSHCYLPYVVNLMNNINLIEISKCAFYKSTIFAIYIPQSLKTIGNKAFAFNQSLNYIYCLNKKSNLEIIGKGAFEATDITSFYFPPKLSQIKNNAFTTSNIIVTKFSPLIKLKSIGRSAFSYTQIEHIRIPSSVEIIEREAFYSCVCLKYVEFQLDSCLNTIKPYAFYNSSLTSISIPSCTSLIEKNVFESCLNFVAIEILGESHTIKIHCSAFKDVPNNFSLFASKSVTIILINE